MTARHARSTVGAGDAGAHRVAAGLLARGDEVPEAAGVGAGVADADGAGHVGAVAVDDAAEVDDDELAAADAPVGRAGVRLRGVRARRDDRVEAHAARTAAAHRVLELDREVCSVGRVSERREQLCERVVGDGARGAGCGPPRPRP